MPKKRNEKTIPLKEVKEGMTIGNFTLIKESCPRIGANDPRWLCECKCGKRKELNVRMVASHRIKSCGCINLKNGKMSVHDIGAGTIIGKLTLLEKIEDGKTPSRSNWKCLCECGNIGTFNIKNILKGIRQSCGCLIIENSGRRIHGQASRRTGETPEYKTWMNMLARCSDSEGLKKRKEYKNYIGRGITVCDRWKSSFQNFFDDMGRKPSSKHSIDRINNDGNYEPSNCRWATSVQQGNNRRFNKLIKINDQVKTLEEWSRDFNIKSSVARKRIESGWPIKEAFLTPILPPTEKFISKDSEKLSTIERDKVVWIRTQEESVRPLDQESQEEDLKKES